MATVYGTNATKRDVNVPSDKINGGDQGGVNQVMYDEYTTVGNLGSSDVIKFGYIPAGARVLGVVLSTDAQGGSCAGTLGWAASSDAVEAAQASGLMASQTLVSAAVFGTTSASQTGLLKRFLSPVQVQIALSAASAAGAGKLIKVAVHYTVD